MISVPTLNPTDLLLTRVLNMRQVRDYPHSDNPATRVHVFEMGGGGAHAKLHVAVQPDLPVAQQGAGGVHHVAFRSADADYDAWADRLNEFNIPNSGKVDRFWFRSLYCVSRTEFYLRSPPMGRDLESTKICRHSASS